MAAGFIIKILLVPNLNGVDFAGIAGCNLTDKIGIGLRFFRRPFDAPIIT